MPMPPWGRGCVASRIQRHQWFGTELRTHEPFHVAGSRHIPPPCAATQLHRSESRAVEPGGRPGTVPARLVVLRRHRTVQILGSEAGEFLGVPSSTHLVVVFLRLVAAAVLGGLVGAEREWVGKPAGLRTHMLVSLGAALFVLAPTEAGLGEGD